MKQTAILIGFILLLAVIGNAQVSNNVTAKIPFDFYVQDEKMPAGEYTVVCTSKQWSPNWINIVSKDGKERRIVSTMLVDLPSSSDPADPKMVFNRYGDTYVLSKIMNPREQTGFEIRRAQTERNLGRAFGKPTQETVAIKRGKN